MKKSLKITLIFLGILIGIIVLDTLQAKILDNSPLIKIRKEFKDGYVQYMDKGILVNHYYCINKEEKTIWKSTKYSCPIYEEDNKAQELSERRKNLESLIKNEMINKQFLDKDNLKSFEITGICIYGYYKGEEKKYMQINFKAVCNDDSKSCINDCRYDEEKKEYIKWIVSDESKIYEFKDGVSISYDELNSGSFIMSGEEIK